MCIGSFGTIDIPDKQWAQVVETPGSGVIYKDIPVQQPGPDEVSTNIKFSGVCYTDLHTMKGDWPLKPKWPLVGGHEGAGVVITVIILSVVRLHLICILNKEQSASAQ